MSRRITATLLAFFLGGLGVHKFYLGDMKMGVIYLIFSWTGIPSILGLIDLIQYLRMTDSDFDLKYPAK